VCVCVAVCLIVSESVQEIFECPGSVQELIKPSRVWVGLCTSLTRIAMLAGVFIHLIGLPKPDRLKDRVQTMCSSLFLLTLLVSSLYFPIILIYYFSYFRALLVRI